MGLFSYAQALGFDMEWLFCNVGALLSHAGELSLATRVFKDALNLDPYFPQTHFGLGYVAVKSGRLEEAVAAYREAVRLKPDYAEAYYMLGVSHHLKSDPSSAAWAWEKFLSLEPDSPRALEVRTALQQIRRSL